MRTEINAIIAEASYYGVSIIIVSSIDNLKSAGVYVPNPTSVQVIIDALALALSEGLDTVFLVHRKII